MKKLALFLVFHCLIHTIISGQDFITKWKFDSIGTTISFNALTEGEVNYTWSASPSGNKGSGSFNSSTNFSVTLYHLDILAGDIVTLSMAPENLRRFYFQYTSLYDKSKLIDVAQWGAVKWSSMVYAFGGCVNVNFSAKDKPDLTSVMDMSHMFTGAKVFNSNIGDWDVSNVNVMTDMFAAAKSFNQDISQWNTDNVKSMSGMFFEAISFNQYIGGWNTSNVMSMSAMFYKAISFNQNIGKWNLSSIQNPNSGSMNSMLDDSGMDCNNYSATLNGWRKNNPNVKGVSLGAFGIRYGSNIKSVRNDLLNSQEWYIFGDKESTGKCNFSEFKDSLEVGLKVYPNPTYDEIFIETNLNEQVSLYNSLGMKVSSHNLNKGKNNLELNNASGLYILEFHNSKKRVKVIKH
jgi:surface protein